MGGGDYYMAKTKFYAIVLTVLLTCMVIWGLGDFRAKQLALDLTAERVYNVVTNYAKELDGVKLAEAMRELDAADPYLEELANEFGRIIEAEELENFYIVAKNDTGHWYYVLDGRGRNHPQYAPPGTEDRNIDVTTERAIRGLDADMSYASGRSSARLSSFIGITAPNGEYFAVIGADFNAGALTDFLYTTKYAQFFVLALGAFILGIVLLVNHRQKEKS
jgi:hypothetical protein